MKKILTFFILMFFCLGVLAETETNENIQKIINAESADSQVKKLDKLFIQHFKSIRKKCESNLTNVLEERAKKIMGVKDKGAGLEEHANKLIIIAPVLARSGCIVKFRIEMEKILFSTFLKTEESKIFNQIINHKFIDSEKNTIKEALLLAHDIWIIQNIKSINKNIANERNTKFNGLTEGILGFYVNIPELGCNQKNDNDKFSCK